MKILLHAINGVGLGHLVRSVEIARALLRRSPEVEIVFVTNSVFPELITREGFKLYRLKFNTTMVLNGKISYEDYVHANYLRIKAVIQKERPDVVLLDSEFNKRLVDFCRDKKIKTSFVLRKTTDRNLNYLCQQGFLDKVDLILVPHVKDEISQSHRDIFSRHNNVQFVGPILRPVAKGPRNTQNGKLNILITFAAGPDIVENKILYSKVSDFLSELKKRKMSIGNRKVNISIVTGPLFHAGICDLQGFNYQTFENDLTGLMTRSDLVISPAGYNLINEIIHTQTPALLIPLERKEDDQHARAKSLEDRGCALVVQAGLWEALEQVIKDDGLENMRSHFPVLTPGNDAAAEVVMGLMPKKPRVLFLRACWLPLSERFIYDELESLKGYQPVVVCLDRKDNFANTFEVLHDRRFNGLWNSHYPAIPNEKMVLHSQLLQWIMSEIKARDIKILHAQFFSDAEFFIDLKRLSGLPLVVSVRGADLYTRSSADFSRLFAEADRFLVRSETMKNDLIALGCPEQKITVHHSGIHLSLDEPLKTSVSAEVRLLMVGRLVEKKGTSFGIDVFNQLCGEFDNLKLYIVGDGPLREGVHKAALQSPYSDRIVICGELPNSKVLAIMKRCHLLLHPSMTARNGDREGVPGAIMEAMAHGILVVASRHGSIPEIVEHGQTGILFNEQDRDDAVEQAGLVIKNRKQHDVLRKNALEKVKADFDITVQTEKLEAIYNSFLKSGPWDKYERFFLNYQSVIHGGRPSFFRADVHPVRGCNSYCVMCDHWKQKKSEFLSKQQIFNTIRELKEIGAQEIRFHGHEPTLRSDLLDLIDFAKTLGLWVGLKTNCVGLDREYCRRLARLDKLYVSIDSPVVSMHNKMRGNKESFKDNLRVMSWVRAENPAILLEANSVVTRLNYQTLGGMPQLADRLGISKVSFVLLNSKNKREVANLLPRSEQMREFYLKIVPEIIQGCLERGILFDFSPFFADLVLEDPRKMLSEIRNHPEKFEEEIKNYIVMDYGKTFYQKYGCHGPVDHLSMNYDGHIYPCCVVERVEANAVGNIIDSSFAEVWDSEKYKRIRNDTVASGGTCCPHSATCASNFGSRKYLAQRIQSSLKHAEASS